MFSSFIYLIIKFNISQFIDAVKNENFGYQEYEAAMRIGIRKCKNNIYKKNFDRRNVSVQ